MKKKIAINYLPWRRPEFAELTFKQLNKISDENKEKIIVNILTQGDIDYFDRFEKNFDFNVVKFSGGNNYIDKLRFAINQPNEYSIKLDEDIFMSYHLWNWFIENINLTNEYCCMMPMLSTGIPTCDEFAKGVLSYDDLIKLYDIYITTEMPNGLWNQDYSSLNKYMIMNEHCIWDTEVFYNAVDWLDTPFKGIHPMRISYDAHWFLNEKILENYYKVSLWQPFSTEIIDAPYFTNSCFGIRTAKWNYIINKVEGPDRYDEVPMNLYVERTQDVPIYIQNGFAIHTMHNCLVGEDEFGIGRDNAEQREKDFFKELLKREK